MRNLINKFLLMFAMLFIFLIIQQTSFCVNSHLPELKGNISGLVTDKNNKPLEFAVVSLNDLGLTVSTDNKGEFTFVGVPFGTHMLTIRLSGFNSKSLSIELSSNDTSVSVKLEESLIETPVIDVTGSFNILDINKSTFSITELSSRTITKTRSQNLAETIQNVPGINNISTGSGIGKPVIRGLTSQGVLVVHDGVKQESQQWGDEHGPELSLFDLDRIEILRGPSSLVYGSDAIGGVINVISKPLEFSTRKKPVYYGVFTLGGFSGDDQYFGNASLGTGFNNFGVKGHIGYRRSGDIKTPEGLFEVNTLNGTHQITGGKLFNSGSKELEGGANLGFTGKFGVINAGFDFIRRRLNIHEDPEEDPLATPNQQVNTSQYSADADFILGKNFKIEPVVSYQQQTRIEYESDDERQTGTEALHLDLSTFEGTIKLHHSINKYFSGTSGISYSSQLNRSIAEDKLIPNYNAGTIGIFAAENLDLGKLSISAGIRFDSKKLNIEETVFQYDTTGNPLNVVNAQSLSFNSFTGSVGAVYNPSKSLSIYANLGRGWRAPSEFELFVDGVHEGTGRYERGLKILDPSAEPKPEESVNIDLGFRVNLNNFNLQLSVYRNLVNNFIYPQFTGDTIDSHPVFNNRQDKSTFYGYEYSIQYQPLSWLVFNLSGDYVHTKNNATGYTIPFTPPVKNVISIKLQKRSAGKLLNPYIKAGLKIVLSQNNIDITEAVSPGYSLFNAGFGIEIPFAGSVASADFTCENMLDTKYVDHLSRYKGYAMNPGRSINLQLNLPFRF